MFAAAPFPEPVTFARRALPPVRILAWGAWIVIAASVVASAAVWAADGFPALPLSFAKGPTNVAAVGLLSLTSGTVGALLAWRHPRNAIGWLLLLEGLLTAFLTPVNLLVGQAFEAARLWPATTVLAAWVMSSLLTPVSAAIAILVLIVFPDGRFAGRRWWIAAALTVVGTALLAVASAVGPSGMLWYPAVPNPTAAPYAYDQVITGLRVLGVVVTVVALALAASSIAVRYRHADRRLRLQLRWIVAGVAVMGAAFVPFLVARYVMEVGETASEVLLVVMAVGVSAFPLTVAVAIVREHLFEIDEIIWRTLVYVPLMGLLAGLYAASVALFQRVFVSLTGNGSDAAIVISSLMLAGTFTPARSAIEARVSRRFKPTERPRGAGQAGEPMSSRAESPAGLVADARSLMVAVPAERLAALEERVAMLEGALRAAVTAAPERRSGSGHAPRTHGLAAERGVSGAGPLGGAPSDPLDVVLDGVASAA